MLFSTDSIYYEDVEDDIVSTTSDIDKKINEREISDANKDLENQDLDRDLSDIITEELIKEESKKIEEPIKKIKSIKDEIDSKYDFLFKIVIIGDSGVGKSAIFKRYVDNEFHQDYISTIGVDFKIKTVNINNKITKIQLWDTAGQDRFKTITTSYYRGAHGIILVYDVTDMESFDNIKEWINEVDMKSGEDTIRILVGNKIDLSSRKVVSTELADNFARKNNMILVECSAKNSINIDSLFVHLIQQIKTTMDINNAGGDFMRKSILLHTEKVESEWCCI